MSHPYDQVIDAICESIRTAPASEIISEATAGWRRYDVNRFGIKVSVHGCWWCGDEFTVCPAVEPDAEGWDGCMAPGCATYDPERDAV